jgi:nucleotide-binding universal stress UspA family protein
MKIVVAVDGSPASTRAVEWCAAHAPALDAEVVALYVVEMSVLAASSVSLAPLPTLSEADRERLLDVVTREWCAPLAANGVSFRVVMLDGSAASTIMEVADKEDADLVVTGRRGLRGFSELLLGSTSHQLTLHLHRPLLIIS